MRDSQPIQLRYIGRMEPGSRQLSGRFLAVDAGPFCLALPLGAVRQILDVGGEHGSAPLDARALGVVPLSLAALLGATPLAVRPALLLFDGLDGPVLLTVCALVGVFDAVEPAALPETVACRWPGLITGIVKHAQSDAPRLALDARFVMGLVEGGRT